MDKFVRDAIGDAIMLNFRPPAMTLQNIQILAKLRTSVCTPFNTLLSSSRVFVRMQSNVGTLNLWGRGYESFDESSCSGRNKLPKIVSMLNCITIYSIKLVQVL